MKTQKPRAFRGRKSCRKPSMPQLECLHDRKAAPNPHLELAPDSVDDPYEHGQKIEIVRNLRGDPLARLFKGKKINEAQYVAGRHFQRVVEQASLAPCAAIDASSPFVDRSITPKHLNARQWASIRDLGQIVQTIGRNGRMILEDYLIECLPPQAIARKYHLDMRRGSYDSRSLFRIVRLNLEALAVEFGYASRMAGGDKNGDSKNLLV